MFPNALNVYKNNSVQHSSKDQMLIMLVDGAVRFSKQSEEALKNKDMKKSHEYLVRTQDIITELMVSLDTSAGDWAVQMFNVYSFIKEKLVEANLKKDVNVLHQAMPLINEVRDIWHEANKISKQQR